MVEKYIGKLLTIFIVTFIIFQTTASSISNDYSTKRSQFAKGIRIHPKSVTINNDESLKLECGAYNLPKLSKIFWIRGESIKSKIEELKKSHTQHRLTDSADYIIRVNSTYIIDCPSEHDSNLYTCVVFAGNKTYKGSSHVTVIGKSRENCERSSPKIFENVSVLMSNMGSTITLHCKTPNNSRITWKSTYHLMSSERYTIENRKLTIRHLAWKDMGVFICESNYNTGDIKFETFVYPMKV